MADLTTIRNIGPAFAKELKAAGISSAEALREVGADAAYEKLLQNGTRPHFIAYYVLHMGLQGRPWNDCKGAEKDALRKKFDQLKSQSFDTDRSELEQFLNRIGVIDPPA
ncbi:TfoX C-terminal domain-containing protein [Cognatiyoonia koreensis]|uniref:TfoX C-terminal domain-containing protein n=1 Tax=Cognatiyoonia koreensis TaxID=364200 RepID=A0A1I0NYV8_9RHOB|nr:TfoX/Sxy family protein [Cognatiyoonia koreensis]SEW07062.1 TfoX C-terminal domain-containing protein [Cognatiyoonia koreensis]